MINIFLSLLAEMLFSVPSRRCARDPEFLERATDIIEAQVEVTELMGAEIYVYMTIEGESAVARVDPSSTAEAGRANRNCIQC